jgi:Secretion system C-terminal sorting domain
MHKIIIVLFLLNVTLIAQSQILGGGTNFAGAQVFNQSWLTSCPSSGTVLSNQAAFEPTTAMDGCAPAPACNVGTTGSDIWFYFFATSATASIVINPSASFDAAIQAFSGSACPGLTTIGCVDAGGNNQIETLNLAGLTSGTRYYFRVFGATNSGPNRTGTYTFCGSAGLGSAPLPVILISFSAVQNNNSITVKWATASEQDHQFYLLEHSTDGINFLPRQKFEPRGGVGLTANYEYADFGFITGKNYYRLKIAGSNGDIEYSKTILVNGRSQKRFVIFPNPSRGDFFIDSKENTTVILFSIAGFKIKSIQLKAGRNEIVADNLPAGTYYLRVPGNDEPYAFSVVN